MAFFRFTRDKRGYENFYLVEPTTNRRGKVRQRLLYWFRTPPDIRVGREPFDEGVRRALEAQNPHVTFDWRSILEAPIPSADADKWRERRRAERAAKQALAAEVDDAEVVAGAADEAETPEQPEPAPERAEAVSVGPAPLALSPADGARRKRRRRRGRRPSTPGESGRANDIPETGESHDPTEPTGE